MKTLPNAILSAVLILVCSVGRAETAPRAVKININAPTMAKALIQFTEQSGLHLIFPTDGGMAQLPAPRVVGAFTPEAALEKLLSNTGLEYEYVDAYTVAVHRKAGDTENTKPVAEGAGHSDTGQMKLAQGEGAQDGVGSAGGREKAEEVKLEEIVVTAQKRGEERLQDVPIPVTAISADTLVATNQLQVEDYYTRIPGLNLVADSAGLSTRISIRGITSGAYTASPVVGTLVDDVPYASSTGFGMGKRVPDIDPNDLTRVEVLRGPQGTLYGASSMGGLIKFVTVDPSTDGLSGRLQVGGSSVRNGDDLGYNLRGSVNVPLSDAWAVRASGFTRRDPGYIDDPGLGLSGVNRTDAAGGRLSALWRPSQAFSLKLSALVQEDKLLGSPLVTGPELQQSNTLQLPIFYRRETQAYSANVMAKLASVDLTSVSGYNRYTGFGAFDDSPYAAVYGLPAGVGLVNYEPQKTTKFSQEIRLSAPLGQKFEWLFGAFYTREDSSAGESFVAMAPPATVVAPGELGNLILPTTFTEYSGFADLTLKVTDRFDVQIGGRESQLRQTYALSLSGVFGTGVTPEVGAKENVFTYLVTPRVKLSPNLMAYARLATGYRSGGVNPSPQATQHTYDPDKTANYEMGVKGDFRDHTLFVDASLYYIDWKDIQQAVYPPGGVVYLTNASRAKSQGVELSLTSRPLTGLTITAWGAWNDAVLTEGFPPISTVHGLAGDRLPWSAVWSGNISLDQEFSLARNVTGLIGANLSYVGDRKDAFPSSFTSSLQRLDLPSYVSTDVHAGVRYESWTVNFFANNVFDKRGLLTGSQDVSCGCAFAGGFLTYIHPRTIGLSLSKDFGRGR